MYDMTAKETYMAAKKARIKHPDSSLDILLYKEFLESQEVVEHLHLGKYIDKDIDEELEWMMQDAALSIGLYYHYSRDVEELQKALWYMTDVFSATGKTKM